VGISHGYKPSKQSIGMSGAFPGPAMSHAHSPSGEMAVWLVHKIHHRHGHWLVACLVCSSMGIVIQNRIVNDICSKAPTRFYVLRAAAWDGTWEICDQKSHTLGTFWITWPLPSGVMKSGWWENHPFVRWFSQIFSLLTPDLKCRLVHPHHIPHVDDTKGCIII